MSHGPHLPLPSALECQVCVTGDTAHSAHIEPCACSHIINKGWRAGSIVSMIPVKYAVNAEHDGDNIDQAELIICRSLAKDALSI